MNTIYVKVGQAVMSRGLARPQITQKSLRRPQKSTKDQKKGSWLVTDKMHAGSDLSKVAANGLQCLLCLPLMDLAEAWGLP